MYGGAGPSPRVRGTVGGPLMRGLATVHPRVVGTGVVGAAGVHGQSIPGVVRDGFTSRQVASPGHPRCAGTGNPCGSSPANAPVHPRVSEQSHSMEPSRLRTAIPALCGETVTSAACRTADGPSRVCGEQQGTLWGWLANGHSPRVAGNSRDHLGPLRRP